VANLAKYDAACRAIAEAKSVDEVKGILDKAEALRAYARQAKNRTLEIDSAEIRIRAERRLGEMIVAQKETVGLAKNRPGPGRGKAGTPAAPALLDSPPTLAEAGIDKKLSARAQKIAAVPEEKFEGMVGEWRGRIQEENERVTVNLLREGARAIRDEILPAPALPKGKSSVLYADPPCRARNNGYTTVNVGVPVNLLFRAIGSELRVEFTPIQEKELCEDYDEIPPEILVL
jgi:hypothetical protein